MKNIILFAVSLLFFSCSDSEDTQPVFSKDYGGGLYIATSSGISFYNGDTVMNQIYQSVNGIPLSDVKKIKFRGTKAFILSDKVYTANIQTFENKGFGGNFIEAVDFVFVSPDDRMFVVDRGDSKVKEFDIENMQISSDIETGDNTSPISLINRYYRTIVMNGGSDSNKDSTIIVIDHKDNLVPLANMMGSLYIGDNPNSAISTDDLKVLCSGVYDISNPSSNTFSSLVKVNPWDLEIAWTQTMNNIYNAANLTSNNAGNVFFFTASDGVYSMNNSGTGVNQVIPLVSDVLLVRSESYNPTDSTTATSNMLYVNDSQNAPSTIYKYNISLSSYVDTIDVEGSVLDINYY